MSKCLIIQRPQRVVVVSKCFGSRGPQGVPGTPGGQSQPFTSVSQMLLSPIQWAIAECSNYTDGDGTLSIWIRATNNTVIPNGTNILQTSDGRTIIRVYVFEGSGGTVVTPSLMPTFQVSVPLEMPTVDDLRSSIVTAPKVAISNPSTPYTFIRGDTSPGFVPGTDDGLNEVINAVGVHYIRWRGL